MSFVWTDEEASFLKAVLRWQDREAEAARRKAAIEAERRKKTVGEFRILVVGAKGCGKTSLLTRVNRQASLFLPLSLIPCILFASVPSIAGFLSLV